MSVTTDGSRCTELSRVAERWSLEIGEPIDGGSFSLVVSCVDSEGNQLVLKLPHADFDPCLESLALRAWNGSGAVRVRRFDADTGAILLDRVVPGTPLAADNHQVAVEVAGELLGELHGVELPAEHEFPTFMDAFDGFLIRTQRNATPGAAGLGLLDLAREAAARLSATASRNVLLHGDFIDKNILLGPRSYVAIDPAPRIGDPCSDVGVFASFRQPARVIGRVARSLGSRLGLDRGRCEAWAAVWAIGEACETWRADTEELQGWVQDEALRVLGLFSR